MHLLIVEDDEETAAYMRKGLTEAGYTVDHSANGRDGLFMATSGTFDAIIMDRMLPGLDAAIAEDRISVWMGHRPSLPDSLPVIGASRASADVFHAFGHGHVGMTGAPGTSQVIADLVAGRPPSIDIVPFRADRFG